MLKDVFETIFDANMLRLFVGDDVDEDDEEEIDEFRLDTLDCPGKFKWDIDGTFRLGDELFPNWLADESMLLEEDDDVVWFDVWCWIDELVSFDWPEAEDDEDENGDDDKFDDSGKDKFDMFVTLLLSLLLLLFVVLFTACAAAAAHHAAIGFWPFASLNWKKNQNSI